MKFGFYSTMSGLPWGGSEVLWSRLAARLLNAGHSVTACVRWWADEARSIGDLKRNGATVYKRRTPWLYSWMMGAPWESPFVVGKSAKRWLAAEKPDFVLVSIGSSLDPIKVAHELTRQKVPYAINLQSACPSFIDDYLLDEYREAYANAKQVFFVSAENQQNIETNLAMKLDNATVIDNPFGVEFETEPNWPQDDGIFRLACVARLHFASKGQDLLVQILRQEKWRSRNLRVRMFGDEQGHLRQMNQLIAEHQLMDQLEFAGYCDNVQQLWAEHHGLLLPSRFEGAALAVVEALLCNRICITTDVGRNRELIDDNETGFIAAAPTVGLLDEALERAWQRRNRWQQMGELAGKRIRQRYSPDPIRDFHTQIKALTNDH